ncbi:MAG: hypothetical protein WB791_07170 [Waddliaceae bacterium]
MAIIGQTVLSKYRSRTVNVGNNFNKNFLDKPQRWSHILPAFDLRIGLDYSLSVCRCAITAAAGYELHSYPRSLRYASENISTTAGSAEIPLFSSQYLKFGGPYVSLTASF